MIVNALLLRISPTTLYIIGRMALNPWTGTRTSRPADTTSVRLWKLCLGLTGGVLGSLAD